MGDPLWLYDLAGSYQANFSVAQAKQEGYVGGVSKITEGLSGSAGTVQPNWDKVNKAWSQRWHDDSMSEGQIWGGYHFLHNGNGAAQARYFLDEFNKITGKGVDGYLVQCDCESDADWQTIQDFSNEFYRQTNDHPYLMYTGGWWWNVGGRRWDGNSLTPYLWHSEYVSGSGYGSTLYQQVTPNFWTPGYGNWPRATILQFSSKGSAGGLVANLDVNAFQGTMSDLLKLTGGKQASMTITLDDFYARAIQGTLTPDNVLFYLLRQLKDSEDPGLDVFRKEGWTTDVPGLKQLASKLDDIRAAQSQPAPVTITPDDMGKLLTAIQDSVKTEVAAALSTAGLSDAVKGAVAAALGGSHTYTVTQTA